MAFIEDGIHWRCNAALLVFNRRWNAFPSSQMQTRVCTCSKGIFQCTLCSAGANVFVTSPDIFQCLKCNKKAIDFLLFSNYKLIETSITACEASNLTSSPPTKCNNLPLGCNLAKIALAVAPKVQLIASKVQLIAPKLQLLAPKVQLIASRVQLLAPKQYKLFVR